MMAFGFVCPHMASYSRLMKVLPGMITEEAKLNFPAMDFNWRREQVFLEMKERRSLEYSSSLSFGSRQSWLTVSNSKPKNSMDVHGPQVLCSAMGRLMNFAKILNLSNAC